MTLRFETTRPCLLAIALLTVGSSAAITQENVSRWTPEILGVRFCEAKPKCPEETFHFVTNTLMPGSLSGESDELGSDWCGW